MVCTVQCIVSEENHHMYSAMIFSVESDRLRLTRSESSDMFFCDLEEEIWLIEWKNEMFFLWFMKL